MPHHDCSSGPCLCPPSPAVMAARAAATASNSSAPSLAAARPSARPLGVVTSKIPGLNDGITRPESKFEPGQRALSAMRKVSLERPAPVDSDGIQHVRLLIILVEFEDQKIGTGKHEYFKDLFFSENKIESGSAAEYYKDVSNGKVQMSGDVVGPYKLPRSLVEYCNGDSGAVEEEPNAQTMARDALEAIMTDPVNPINISQYDSGDEDRFVDGLVIVHAGSGAEAEPDDRKAKNLIWSLQWNIGTPVVQDGVSAFAFLTIPEDALLGVTVHELGHLLFHWPDLYDPDNSSNGIGDWCLMAAGSWNALPGKPAGTKPAHPSGWCKLKQGWVEAVNVAENQSLTLKDVKASWQVHRLWKNGDLRNKEYFLLENRQKTGYDTALPGDGLFVWHIDDNVQDQTNELHYLVGLMQADGKKNLEGSPGSSRANQGDSGDPFPGSKNVATFNSHTNPSSKSYAGRDTNVTITKISPSGPSMTMDVKVKTI